VSGSRRSGAAPIPGDHHDSGNRGGYDRCKHDFH
jgi:hypothetical protein